MLSILLMQPIKSFGQSDSTTFKDSITISNSSFLNSCIKTSKSANGENLNHNEYCACMLEKMSKNFGLMELNNAIGGNKTIDNLKNGMRDSTIMAITISCYNENIENNSSDNQ